MSVFNEDKAKDFIFQNDVVQQFVAKRLAEVQTQELQPKTRFV